METQVEELGGDRVRLSVEVPSAEVRHAVEHAASDLAGTLKIPGFRKGKVPMPVLISRVGKERLMSEAVDSHIGGWFWNAAAGSNIRPVTQPEYEYELPSSSDDSFAFTAEVGVQPKADPADWTTLEVPAEEPDVPAELVDHELEALRSSVAELVPVEGRGANEGDALVIDADVDGSGGEAQRDLVVTLGAGRLLPDLEAGIAGMTVGETKEIEYALPEGETKTARVTVKELKEPVLPPLDDELARAASEFDTLEELRGEIEGRLREQIEEELEGAFRGAAVDALVDSSGVEVSDALVEARAGNLIRAFLNQLERRGISLETYLALSGETAEEIQQRMLEDARRSLGRELVLEAVAEQLGIEVSDEELRAFIREQAELADEDDPDEVVEQVWHSGRHETLRTDLRLRAALDRVASEVKRISPELASAREKLWTPGQEKPEGASKLWTPGEKEPA
ncbi:MAG TPA: trigger factor [Gaiellaceae bacterium]|nr:trigger factor [Gaiellaceae bacterium]